RPREPYLRLFYEIYGLAAAHPEQFKDFVQAVGADYFTIMETGLRSWCIPERESRVLATRYLATFRGMMLDLLTTGDRARIDATAEHLAAEIERELHARRPSASAADGRPLRPSRRNRPER